VKGSGLRNQLANIKLSSYRPRRTSLVVIGTILVALFHLGINAAFATESDDGYERRIVDAILNQSYSPDYTIEPLINALDTKNAVIPEPNFYRGLAIWHRGYQNENSALKNRGIKDLQNLSKKVDVVYTSDNPRNHFIVGMIKAYTARALFENEQIIKGYYTGIDAVDRLQKFISSASHKTAGYHDAKFLLALYSIYTHDLKNRNHWLIGTVKSVGNKNAAIKDIHKAIESNAIFASESARSFLSEVQWRTPDVCNYRDLARSAQSAIPNNLDLALLTQGLLMKCGYPEIALEINNRFHTRSDLPESVSKKLLKARLRILVDMGDLTRVQALALPASLRSHQALAVANTLDVNLMRREAIELYNKLVNNNTSPNNIKRVAAVRLTYPYRLPKKIINTEKLSQLRISQNNQK